MVTLPLDGVAQTWNAIIATLEWGTKLVLFSCPSLTVVNIKRFLEGLKEHVVEISNYFFPPIDNSKLLKIASALPETQGSVTLSKWGFWYLL